MTGAGQNGPGQDIWRCIVNYRTEEFRLLVGMAGMVLFTLATLLWELLGHELLAGR